MKSSGKYIIRVYRPKSESKPSKINPGSIAILDLLLRHIRGYLVWVYLEWIASQAMVHQRWFTKTRKCWGPNQGMPHENVWKRTGGFSVPTKTAETQSFVQLQGTSKTKKEFRHGFEADLRVIHNQVWLTSPFSMVNHSYIPAWNINESCTDHLNHVTMLRIIYSISAYYALLGFISSLL